MFKEKTPGAPRIALVGCSASKCIHPGQARDFYTSRLFRASYAYAEKTCDAVFIVSASYHVVAPTQKLHPYDRSLCVYNKRERENWGVRTIGQLLPGVDMLPQLVILAVSCTPMPFAMERTGTTCRGLKNRSAGLPVAARG